MERKLIDIDDLARLLSVAKGTIYNWCSQRKIPFVKVERCLRFDIDAIAEFIKARTTPERRDRQRA